MEDVIGVYTRPYDPMHPVVCFDESSKQLVGETVQPLPMEPGQPQRYDYHYQRNGVCNLFMFSEPLAGRRYVEVTDRRIPDKESLQREIAAWEQQRNRESLKIDWQFTTADARVKLKRLYPSIQS